MEIPDDVSPGHPEYWTKFYQQRGPDDVCDWFLPVTTAMEILTSTLSKHSVVSFDTADALEVGCGTSDFAYLLRPKVRSMTAVDLCEEAVQYQQDRHSASTKKKSSSNNKAITFEVADVCDEGWASKHLEEYDLVVDKGTLDALLSSDLGCANAEKYALQVGRCLKKNNQGVLFILSLNDSAIVLPYFVGCEEIQYSVVAVEVIEQSLKQGSGSGKGSKKGSGDVDAGVISTGARYSVIVLQRTE
eukprot:PhF_6_TR33616/c0_g1_i2/m.49095